MRIIPLKITNQREAKAVMEKIGVSSHGIERMVPKTVFHTFRIDDISSFAANIIKQHMLSVGSDAALSREVLTRRIKTSVFFFG